MKNLRSTADDLGSILIAVRNDVMKETQRKQVPWEHSALTGRFYFHSQSQPIEVAKELTINPLPPSRSEAEKGEQGTAPQKAKAPRAAAFDGEWEVSGASKDCPLKTWKALWRIQANKIAGNEFTGIVKPDGTFEAQRPGAAAALMIGTYVGKFGSRSGNGTYTFGRSCNGTIALKMR